MTQLFPDSQFQDFGSSQFLVPNAMCRTMRIAGSRSAELRRQVRLLAPNKPGVYGMIDAQDQLIYVGKAKNLRTRLQSYFRRKGRPPKAGKIIARAKHILWEIVPSEFASLLGATEVSRTLM